MTSKSSSQAFLTSRQVAELFQVTPMTVRRWGDAGSLESTTTPGGHRRFNLDHVHRFARNKGITLDSAAHNWIDILIISTSIEQNHNLHNAIMAAKASYLCHFASNSFDAGLLLYRHKPRIVIIDTDADDLDAKLICQTIKSKPDLANIKLITLGLVEDELAPTSSDCPIDLQLDKPLKQQALNRYLNRL